MDYLTKKDAALILKIKDVSKELKSEAAKVLAKNPRRKHKKNFKDLEARKERLKAGREAKQAAIAAT